MRSMGKLRVLFTILVFALIVTVVQIFIYGNMDRWSDIDPFKLAKRSRKQTSQQRLNSKNRIAVSEFLDACKELKIEAVLIDRDILKHLTERVRKYSKEGKGIADEHHGCHYFCNQNVFTFGVFKPIFQESKKWDAFSEQLEKMKFKSELLHSPDDRKVSLEDGNKYSPVIAHAIAYKDRTIIHMVLFHERNQRHWSSTCVLDKQSRIIASYLKNAQFCRNQHILKKFIVMETSMDRLKVVVPFYPVQFIAELEQSTFIPCNMNRARSFYSVYGLDKSVNADIFRIKAKNMLTYVKYHLDQLGVPFWLSSGTCLGWFRQCDFITHSKDIDIGVFIKDYNPDISKKLRISGLLPKHIFGKVEDSFELSFRTASNDLKLDIFFFYEESDYMWNGGTQAKTGNKYKYRFPKFSLCWTEFIGMLVRIPCNTLEYVEANYGKSWGLLIQEWDWKKSPPNVKENGRWSTEDFAKVVQVFQ